MNIQLEDIKTLNVKDNDVVVITPGELLPVSVYISLRDEFNRIFEGRNISIVFTPPGTQITVISKDEDKS